MTVQELFAVTYGTAGRIMSQLDDEQTAELIAEVAKFEGVKLAALRAHVGRLPMSTLVWWPAMLRDGEIADIGTLPEGLDIDHPLVILAITVAARAEIDLRFPIPGLGRPGTY